MDFNPSDLQRMLQDSAERFVAERFTLEHRRDLRESSDGSDHEAWQQFAELGWLMLLVPEELGGLGGTMTDAAVLSAVLGSRCVAEPFASSAVLGATILAGATEPPSDLIAGLIAGEMRPALAHDEPGERYSYASSRSCRLQDDGTELFLEGQKLTAWDAPSATHLIVTASSQNAPCLLLVPKNAAGVSCTDYALYDGSRAADVHFERVRLGQENILARGNSAVQLLGLALDRTRLCLAAQSLGSIEAELELCSAYLKERQQFGQPIGKFQSLQHIMADMFVAAHQARSILYFALSQMEGPEQERTRAVNLARLQIAEAGQLVSRQAIQLHGGYGVTDEYEVSHHYRRQLILEKQYGDVDFAIRSVQP